MSKSITSKFSLVKVIVLLGVVLLAVSVVGWWKMVYSSPKNVFDRMIANTLATPAVTKVSNQVDEAQNLNQISALITEPQQIVHSKSVLTQSADTNTSVITESIGTPDAEFVRYTDINTSQKSATGGAFDFSSVKGVWGKTDLSDPNSGGGQLFNQAVLGVVPTANVRQPYRDALIKEIKTDGVYKTDYSSVKRQKVNGRPVYTYQVEVTPVPYVTMLKNFARSIGLTQLEQVNPEQYKNSAPLQFTFEIDVWSGQLVKVVYTGSSRTETYGGYGANSPIALPAQSIGVDELQNRLQQIR